MTRIIIIKGDFRPLNKIVLRLDLFSELMFVIRFGNTFFRKELANSISLLSKTKDWNCISEINPIDPITAKSVKRQSAITSNRWLKAKPQVIASIAPLANARLGWLG